MLVKRLHIREVNKGANSGVAYKYNKKNNELLCNTQRNDKFAVLLIEKMAIMLVFIYMLNILKAKAK